MGKATPVALNIPYDISLLGLSMYAQGALMLPLGEVSGSPGQVGRSNQHYLTEAVQLVIGR